MIKFAVKDFMKNIFTNIFIALQLAVAFIICIASVSSFLSRTEYYTPVKDKLEGNGFLVREVEDEAVFTAEAERIEEVSEIICGKKSGLYYTTEKTDAEISSLSGMNSVSLMNESFIDSFKPEMKSGCWLSEIENDGKIHAVITENQNYSTGDTIELVTKKVVGELSPDDENYDPDNPYIYEFVSTEAEIVGVIRDGSRILGFSRLEFHKGPYSSNPKPDFRDLYPTVNMYEGNMLIIPENEGGKLTDSIRCSGNIIVRLDNDVSRERTEELEFYLRNFGTVTPLCEFRENSEIYINGELVKLLPILICVIILVITSSVSAGAIRTKGSLRSYAVYYICGAKWSGCVAITLVSNILTTALATMLAVIACKIPAVSAKMSSTVISFGKWQFLFCLAIVVFNTITSMIIPYLILKKNSPKDILRLNE